MGGDQVFLDTTMHFQILSVNKKEREKAEKLLEAYSFKGTSTFTFLEFKGSFLQDLVYVYRNLKEHGFHSIFEKIPKLNKYHQRKISIICSHLQRFCGNDRYDREDALLMIENSIDEYWERIREVDHVKNGTGCVRAQEEPIMGEKTIDVSIAKCYPKKIRCRIHKFFEENIDLFKKIYDEIQQIPPEDRTKELQDFCGIFKASKKNSEHLCSDTVCRKIGDMLIAVDGSSYSNIASTNKKEFDVICRALSKKRVFPV